MSYKDEERQIKLDRIELLTGRLKYLETVKKPYFDCFNSEIFSLSIEVGVIDATGEPVNLHFHNHKTFADITGFEPVESKFFKFYLQEMFTKYQIEYMEIYKEINQLKLEIK